MSAKQEPARARAECAEDRRERILRELASRGVAEGFARAVTDRLMPLAQELPGEQWDSLLSGVALAYGVHHSAVEAFHKTAGDLDEVGRLVGDFGSELGKLDEVLEILAAYVARLRTQTAPPDDTTLH